VLSHKKNIRRSTNNISLKVG
jgi:hypothetical protein